MTVRGARRWSAGFKPRKKYTEDAVQQAVVRALRAALPPSAIVMHIGNGRATPAARMRQAALGAIPGAPDLLILWQGGAGFLEVKAPGAYPKPVQRAFAGRLMAIAVPWACVRSPADALEALEDWGAPLRVKTARAA